VNRSLTVLVACLLLVFAGCASSSVQSRKHERAAVYAALPAESKVMVDQGQIAVGMSPDAVYIAWGAPAQILQQENQDGATTTWLYEGGWMEANRYWYRRSLLYDYQPRTYVRAEVIFVKNVVQEWRTLPQPPN
jgi:hypothetical protein